MHHRTALEGQQRLAALGFGVLRQAVGLVLLHGSVSGLGEFGFHLHRGNRDAVDEEHEVNRQLAGRVVLELRHHAQDVGFVALSHLGVARILGRGFREIDVPTAGDREAPSQRLHRPIGLQRFG